MSTHAPLPFIVGYNTTPTTEDTSILIGVPFDSVDGAGFVPFSALTATPAFENGDQIQVAYTDNRGLTQFDVYEFDAADGWLDPSYDPCGENDGLTVGQSAWFISAGDPKTVTVSGAVKKGNIVRTFTEEGSLISSALPMPFCPNSERVSWGVESGDQIQVAYTDNRGLTQFDVYEYDADEGWLDPGYDPLDADAAIVGAGVGFWLIIQDTSSSFTEVSPLAE